jgi:hypothetical protein
MNNLGFINEVGKISINRLGPIINTNSYNGSGSKTLVNDYIVNLSSPVITTNGLIPIYTGDSVSATIVSSQISQTSGGINITSLNVSSDISTSTITSLNDTITDLSTRLNNAQTLLFNLTGLTI